jgi:hypothetical protein
VSDASPDAYEKLIERLLSSRHYGERWARHWLDLVRYADSDGYRIDDYRPNAWRYRDYVVDALNSDKPYDRFVKEQLAGDELWPQEKEAIVATTFLRHWIYEYNNRDVKGQWTTILNDLTDTTGDLFLGLGVQVRALSRSQVRSDPPEGLLPVAGVFRARFAARRFAAGDPGGTRDLQRKVAQMGGSDSRDPARD